MTNSQDEQNTTTQNQQHKIPQHKLRESTEGVDPLTANKQLNKETTPPYKPSQSQLIATS